MNNSTLCTQNEVELLLKAKNGDTKARNEVIKLNLDMVKKIAYKTIQSDVLTKGDLIQEGIMGLIYAIEKFNPALGFKFSTYASHWVKQAMFKAISEQSYALNIPVYIQETLSRYKKAKQELEQKTQKEVSKETVAQKLNLAKGKIDTFLNVYTKALSLEQSIETYNNKDLILGEIIEDEKQNVEKDVIDAQLKSDIKTALNNLKQKEKDVIILRFGLENKTKKTLEEIGNSYGVTKECIRQIEKRALNKIAHTEFAQNNLISYIK